MAWWLSCGRQAANDGDFEDAGDLVYSVIPVMHDLLVPLIFAGHFVTVVGHGTDDSVKLRPSQN